MSIQLAVRAAAVLIAAVPVGAAAQGIDLFCQGRGDRYVDGAPRARFATAIRLRVTGDRGEALIGDDLLAEDDARGWHEIKKLAVSPTRIDGKIYFNWIFSPVMQLDRESGTLVVTGSLANFTGQCTRFDAKTSRMPAPRAAAPAMVKRPLAPTPAPGIKSDWATPARPAATIAKVRTPGTFVLAKYKGEANWYPAQVLKSAGNLVTVQYSSGTQEALPASLVADLAWKTGTYIECKLAGTTYQPVTITAMKAGYAMAVVTDAGKPAETSMRFCRAPARR